MNNFIKFYNKEENDAIKETGTYVTMAFKWKLAEVRGLQTIISSISEIDKFFDTMQENRFDWNIDTGLLGKISKFEMDLYEVISKEIIKFSRNFSNQSAARNTLSRAFVQYRIVRSLIKKGSILEIGPGSGLLGLLIGRDKNFKYAGMESCQAFYITQHELWKKCFGAKFQESLKNYNSKKITHIPWWNFSNLEYDLPKYDCVTANHVFAEMHEWALIFTIKRIYNVLNNNGLVICEGIGSTQDMTTERVLDEFLKQGFSFLHFGKIKKITGFSNIFIFIKLPNTNSYSVNPHLFLMAKNNQISYKTIRKSIGHLKRGVLSQFGFSLKFITPKVEDKMFYSKKKLLKILSKLEKKKKHSKNDTFLRFINQS